MQDTARAAEPQQNSGYPDENFARLPLLLTPADAARQLSLARYTVYELVRQNQLRARRYGSKILIPREELRRFADSLEQK
jgi:excisionase family DNA binding protein